MINFKFVFLGLLALSVVNAEFLFERNIAADDKFMCLHKKLYRNEKPVAKTNAARILSLRRNLQSETSATDILNLKNYICEADRLNFKASETFCQKVADYLAAQGYSLYYRSDVFKQMVVDGIKLSYSNAQALGQLVTSQGFLQSSTFLGYIGTDVKARVDNMMALLGNNRVTQAKNDGISYERLVYVMLNIKDLYESDKVTASNAYDDYYASNKAQLISSTFNSEATVRWIESIRKRFNEIKTLGDPDTERILEPFFEEGFTPVDTVPTGVFTEPVPAVKTPSPAEIEEKEPTTVTVPKTNEDIIIKDMLIEIQRTYNVEKMLLTYNQLTKSLKEDIDSCKLNLKPAIARCEKFHGVGNCEPISSTMVARKCPVGYVREGASRCLVECPAAEFYTTNRAFCEMKNQLHAIPAIQALGAHGLTQKATLGLSVGACKDGFSLNKFVCYRDCPAGTVAIGGSTCLKNQPIALGAPFVWTAGDE